MTKKLVDWEDFQFTIGENGLNIEFENPEWEEIEVESHENEALVEENGMTGFKSTKGMKGLSDED